MKKAENYTISFAGLSLGKHQFDFFLAQSFFDLFEFEQDFEQPNLTVSVILDKKNNFLDLDFNLSGTLDLKCDLTNDTYCQKIDSTSKIIVKFGEELDDSDDEIWVIPHEEHSISIAQIIYELTLLSIPTKRIHPDVLNGESQSEMLELLDKYSITEEKLNENSNDSEIDPRWEALRKLK